MKQSVRKPFFAALIGMAGPALVAAFLGDSVPLLILVAVYAVTLVFGEPADERD